MPPPDPLASACARDPDPDDAISLVEAYYERGWTDGLPVVPPSEKAIAATLAAAGLAGPDVIGEIPGRNTVVTAEKLAINAVMAGCRPEYAPVVAAAVRGLCHPDFAYHGPASSTGGSAMILIVNGPHARRIGLNSGNNVLGQGWRANATIGRAVRLVMMNVMNTRPGFLDRATLGNPGKYAFCFAENEAASPWGPFHVWRGLRPEQSAVTVYACNSLNQVYNQLAARPEPLLRCFADALCHAGIPNVIGFNESLIVFAGEHAEVLRGSGWSRHQVQQFLVEHARRTVADFKRAARLPGEPSSEDETTWRRVFQDPDDILIVFAGGRAGAWSAALPGWGKKWSRSVTIPIDIPA
jgi:hypothetical protein